MIGLDNMTNTSLTNTSLKAELAFQKYMDKEYPEWRVFKDNDNIKNIKIGFMAGYKAVQSLIND